MRILTLRLCNFQSFGPEPTEIDLGELTYLLGPNGAGKTAVLEALSRLFSPSTAQRRIRVQDFHIPVNPPAADELEAPELWLEVDIEFEEAGDPGSHPSVPAFFNHMALDDLEGLPRVRIRLTAVRELDDYIDERIEYITQVDDEGQPLKRADMSRHDRAQIEVHYLPARRDPADHISFTAASLLGRTLRAADWTEEREALVRLTAEITSSMAGNSAISGMGAELSEAWSALHRGTYFKDPAIAFGRGELEGVLRQLTLTFSPSPGGGALGFERLSDGQKSLLYISLVLAWQSITRRVLRGEDSSLDPDKLRPPVHTIVAIEEPENSLSPQYLGRIIRLLRDACSNGDMQGIIATHAPALLRRVAPESIRFLRLSDERTSTVRSIVLPAKGTEAAKYVREAVEAFPELYFSRLVILGEGDSEQVVLPRVLAASGIAEDDASVSVVPLGGRHVNHFWRLLEGLGIPYVTLLDLDAGRHQGGWGRVRYALNEINKVSPGTFTQEQIDGLPKWDADEKFPIFDDARYSNGGPIKALERRGVFYSYPLDLDLMLLQAYPNAYGVEPVEPDESRIKSVLGKKHRNEEKLDLAVVNLFDDYHRQFKLSSKPAAHLNALAELGNDALLAALPAPLERLVGHIQQKLESIQE